MWFDISYKKKTIYRSSSFGTQPDPEHLVLIYVVSRMKFSAQVI